MTTVVHDEAGGRRTTALRPLPLAAASAGLLFGVAIAGGYGLGWTWTGLGPSDKLWDWLHLLVLPVVLTAVPLWYRTRHRLQAEWRLLVAAVLVALAVTVAGGYGLGWSWTGYADNTLWDWLELLVLPVVLAALPLWLATRTRLQRRWQLGGACVLAALAVTVVGGYGLGWSWTGFGDNTLWDWLHLLLVPFVVPALVAWLSARIAAAEEERRAQDAPAAAGAGAPRG
jgi:uncharacterized membrane protein